MWLVKGTVYLSCAEKEGKNTLTYLTTTQFACVFVSPDNTLMSTVWITYHATVEEELMENLSLWHLHIHKTRQPAA